MNNELRSIFNMIENLPMSYGELDLEKLSELHGDESPIYDDAYGKLDDFYQMLKYLKKPIAGVFKLYLNESGRYQATDGYYFTSGNKIEFYHDEKWHISRVEHSEGYYIYHHRDVELDGLTVRIREK